MCENQKNNNFFWKHLSGSDPVRGTSGRKHFLKSNLAFWNAATPFNRSVNRQRYTVVQLLSTYYKHTADTWAAKKFWTLVHRFSLMLSLNDKSKKPKIVCKKWSLYSQTHFASSSNFQYFNTERYFSKCLYSLLYSNNVSKYCEEIFASYRAKYY